MPEPMTCPKCGSSSMSRRAEVVVMPAAERGLTGTEISERVAFPVQPAVCSKCSFVELYYVPLT